MSKYIGYTVFLLATLLSLAIVGVKTSYAANTVLTDNFTSTSGNWDIIGIRNTPSIKSGAMQLTSSGQNEVGTIWLKDALAQSIKPPYTVTFRFLINDVDKSHVGADGIVFMFNKKQNSNPVSGGGMGFQTGNGYGIEFDTYSNAFDPSVDHISLFKNNPDHSVLKSNILAQINDTTFENAQWHNVKINVDPNAVKVYLDNNLRLNWSGTLDSTYSGIGLTASTGYYYNAQTIDDVVFTKPANVTGVNTIIASGAYPAGTVIPIQLTFNDTVQVTGAPILALNTGRNAVYVSGSGTNTLTFNYTVQAGDNSTSLNYSSNAALSLNGGALFDSSGNIVNLSLENASNSLGASKVITLDTALPTVTASITAGNPAVNTVVLDLAADDSGSGLSQMRFSNDNIIWSDWEPFAVSKSYATQDSSTVRTIYTQVKDKANNISNASLITINPPKVFDSALALVEDTAFNGQVSITNKDNRTNWQIITVTTPVKGTVTLGTASVSGGPIVNYNYAPNLNENGTDSFSFRVSDGISYSNVAKVDLNIAAVNDAPIAINRSIVAVEDVPLTFTVAGTDVDNASLTFQKAGDGFKGTVALLASSGLFSYTPNANVNGTDTFQFKVFDGESYSTGTVNVTIQAVNDAPVAENLAISTNEDVPVAGKLTAFDADGDVPSFKLVSNGSHGNATINADGTYTYTPNTSINGIGVDTFTFRAKDAMLNSNLATVTVNITPVNDAPSFIKGLDQKATADSVAHNVYGWATAISAGPGDESGQTVNFLAANDNNSLFDVQPAVSPDGTLSFTPKANASGTANVTLILQDNGGILNNGIDTSAAQQFTITLNTVILTINSITVSPADVWTKGPVTVSASVYSNTDASISKKWAYGDLSKGDMEISGNPFTGASFTVSDNGIYTIYVYDGPNYDLKQISITQIDHELPTLALNGDASLTIEAGTPFVDPGAILSDNSLGQSIIIPADAPTVNSSTVGDYTLTYSYSDQAGNQAVSLTRVVHVIDTTAPMIALLGANPLNVPANTSIDTLELRASINDNGTETFTADYSSDLNLKLPGEYNLVYTAADNYNNQATVTRKVYVIDADAPTISNIVVQPAEWTKGQAVVSAAFNGTGSEITSLKWAEGIQSSDYFTNSANLSQIHTIQNDSFTVAINGSYTIYAEDEYGNTATAVVGVQNIDTTAPSGGILINNGDASTDLEQVTLQLNASDMQSGMDKMQISNNPIFMSAQWVNYSTDYDWTLLSGDGIKTVYIRFSDAVGNVSSASSAHIMLDTSEHAELSQLTIVGGTSRLSPGFDPAITQYAVTVESSANTIDLLPIPAGKANTISVVSAVGQYISESGIVRSPLSVGNNLITIRVATTKGTAYKDYMINVYKPSSLHNITGFFVNGQAGDAVIDPISQTVSLSVYSPTSLIGLEPQISLSNMATIDYVGDDTNDFTQPVHYLVTAEDGSQAQWTAVIDKVMKSSVDLSNLTLDGFPFPFDPATANYTVEVGPLFTQVALTAVTVDPLAAVAITIGGTVYNEATHNIVLSDGDNLVHIVVTDLNESKSYDLNIHKLSSNTNPVLGYAASNANGTEAILVFKEALDFSTLTPDKFTIQMGEDINLIITSVSYDSGNSDHPIVHLKFAGAPPDINNWKLSIAGVKTAAGADVRLTAFPMTSMAKVQQLNTVIDPLNDGVHMDDIIRYMQTQHDLTGDKVFNHLDIQYLLDQI